MILTILVVQSSFSQKNYLKGYIIKLNGDTIHGFIDYRNWNKNPDKISFKDDDGANDGSYYKPMDIREFAVAQDHYKSGIVEVETSLFNANEINANPDLKIRSDTVFLQTLFDGSRSLSLFVDKSGKEQFYIKKDSSFELLIYKKYLGKPDNVQPEEGTKYNNENNESVHSLENRQYIFQLKEYLQDCESIYSELGKTTYSIKSMENLFNFYYAQTKQQPVIQSRPEKISTELGVLTGLTLSGIKFSSSSGTLPNLVNAEFKESLNFSAGLFLNVVFPRNQGKWSIVNELVYTSYDFNTSVTEDLFTSTYTLGYSYLKLNNMFRLRYPIREFSVWLNAGISNGIVISETNEMQRFTDQNEYDPTLAIPQTRKYEHGYILGIGSGYKKYSFEVRSEWGNGISAYTHLQTSTTRYYFLLGYRF